MNNKEFSQHLETRTRSFAIGIIQLSAKLPSSIEARVIRNQITKSGTSIGANYSEANRSRSRADFIHKIKLCESEANETRYWLDIITDIKWISADNLQNLSTEINELLAIFTSIGNSMRGK